MAATFIIDSNGIQRFLGNNPAPLSYSWTPYGGTDSAPLIPESEWQGRIAGLNMAYLDVMALPPTHDQNGVGQCNCDAATAWLEYCRGIQGMPYVKLSAGDLYHRVNGGVDQGSTLESAMKELQARGVGTEDEYGSPLWSPARQPCTPAQRDPYKVTELWLCPSPAHVMSAALMGFGGVIGVNWYQNFVPDRDGCLPVNGQGGGGGHALFFFPGAMFKNGVYYVPLQNSWRDDWTQWHGRCWLPINHLAGNYGCWTGRVTVSTDTYPTPAETTP